MTGRARGRARGRAQDGAKDQSEEPQWPGSATGAVPKQDVPKWDVPKRDVPKWDVPKQDVPKWDVPRRDVPKRDVPRRDVPKRDVPRRDVPKRDVPKWDVPKKAVPKQPPQTGSGRASHRGGARADAWLGDQANQLAGQVATMALGGGDDGGPSQPFSKKGTLGSKVQLVTNYFRLNQTPDWQLYQYHVDFSPEVESRALRMRFVKDHREMLGPTRAFDGMVLFLAKRLPNDKTEVFSTRRSDDAQIRVTFQLTNELPPRSPTCIQLYNVIFRRLLAKIGLQQIGRHFYNPHKGVTINHHKLEVWPGFITAICQYESSAMLCAEISHKILASDTALDIMDDLYTKSCDFQNDIVKRFVGEIVLTTYNNKTYRVDDIDWKKNPTFKFKKGNVEMDLVTYYWEQYNIEIHDLKQPLLVSMPKARDLKRGQTGPILLIPELCRLTGLSDEVRKDFRVMRDLAVHTRIDPNERSRKLNVFINDLTRNEDVRTELAGWKMSFDNTLLEIQGRTLSAEKITQRAKHWDAQEEYTIRQADAEWSYQVSRDYKFLSSVHLLAYKWVVITTRQYEREANDFVSALKQVAMEMGMVVENPIMVAPPGDARPDFYGKQLQECINRDTSLVVCIVPNNNKMRYDTIKRQCCLERPVPSQVVTVRKLMDKRNLKSVVTKIAIQLNCKLGGEVWSVEIPISGLMVVGVDCYHDSALKGQSVAAFIASTNSRLTKYYSRCNMQMTSQEIVNGLKVNMRNALRNYHQINEVLPKRIIVYRDGVGDGQLESVVEQEIPQIVDSFKTMGKGYDPEMAFIVVKKRINSRFFLRTNHNLRNPLPGTIVDTDVTTPGSYDFFLISQSVRQGTVTPTHYNVVHNSMSTISPDEMQRLTYKLTHLYYNWPGTIRVPAPCQYAHKMAFLVGQSLHKAVENKLDNKLFYL